MKFNNTSFATIDMNLEVPYFEFPILTDIDFVKHGFSTRLGGVSEGNFESMNLGFISGGEIDEPDNVVENFKRIAKSLDVDYKQMVISKQTHKTNIRFVTKEDIGKGLIKKRGYDDIDGLITNTPGITLVTQYADCVPLYLVDIKNKAIGLTHSGWRGTVGKIGEKTIRSMKEHFGTKAINLIAVVGPSICMDCYEVGKDVAKEFIDGFNLDLNTDRNIIKKNEKGKYQLNLWEANKKVLIDAGMLEENINISNVCTSCHSNLLFSHRKTQGKRGTLAAFLTLI